MGKNDFDGPILNSMDQLEIKYTKFKTDLISSDFNIHGKTKIIFMSSLEQIAMIKVITSLGMNESIKQVIINYISSTFKLDMINLRLREIKNCIITKISMLPIPKYIAEKLLSVVSPEIKNNDNQELMYFLLSNLDYDQQQEVFKNCYRSIVKDIFTQWLWRIDFLPIAIRIINENNPYPYFYILEELKVFRKSFRTEDKYYDQYKFIFKQLWRQSSKSLNDFKFDKDNWFTFEKLVAHSLSLLPDLDIIKLIFKELNAHQKKYIFLGYLGQYYFFYLMISDQWQMLELFINYTLPSEKDVSHLKEIFFKDREHEIDEYFLEEVLDKMHYFWRRPFKYEEEILQLWQSLIYKKAKYLIFFIIDFPKTIGEMKKYFSWCFEENHVALVWLEIHFSELYLWISATLKIKEEISYKSLRREICRAFLSY